LDFLGNNEIKKQPIGNQGSGKRNSSNKKEMRTGGAGYRVGTQQDSNCFAWVK